MTIEMHTGSVSFCIQNDSLNLIKSKGGDVSQHQMCSKPSHNKLVYRIYNSIYNATIDKVVKHTSGARVTNTWGGANSITSTLLSYRDRKLHHEMALVD